MGKDMALTRVFIDTKTLICCSTQNFTSIGIEYCYGVKFVVNGGTEGCRYCNLSSVNIGFQCRLFCTKILNGGQIFVDAFNNKLFLAEIAISIIIQNLF